MAMAEPLPGTSTKANLEITVDGKPTKASQHSRDEPGVLAVE
jgi:hypothetical protein